MKTSTKAALLSTFVYPGVGHIYIKKCFVGAVIITIASIALWIIILNAVHIANIISAKIINGELGLNIAAIRDLVEQQMALQPVNVSYATTVLIIIWLVAIIDSFRVGRAKEIFLSS